MLLQTKDVSKLIGNLFNIKKFYISQACSNSSSLSNIQEKTGYDRIIKGYWYKKK